METIKFDNQIVNHAQIEQSLWSEIEPNNVIRLHCNETPFDIPQEIKLKIATKMADLAWNQYPDFHQTKLSSLIAEKANLSAENILLGNGSSQLIQQVVGCFSKFLSEAIIESPTFTFYHQVCQNEKMPYREWNLKDGANFDLDNFPQIIEPALVILTSPNNPTGTILPNTTLETLLKQHSNCIFVIDEAYGEFGGESALPLVCQYSNLLVLKTMSKGYGLPSIRFGYVTGSVTLIQYLKKHIVPFTINVFTELVVAEFLTNPVLINTLKANQTRIKNLRDFVYFLLDEVAEETLFKVLPSAANFLLLRFEEPKLLEKIKTIFQSRNILVAFPIPQCMRISVGTEVEMNKVVRIIKNAIREHKMDTLEAQITPFEGEIA